MSHAARIDYEALSLTARITCEEALKQLCKMDAILIRIKNSASDLLTDKVKGYEAYLLRERSNLQNEINSVIEKSKLSSIGNALNISTFLINKTFNSSQYLGDSFPCN